MNKFLVVALVSYGVNVSVTKCVITIVGSFIHFSQYPNTSTLNDPNGTRSRVTSSTEPFPGNF